MLRDETSRNGSDSVNSSGAFEGGLPPPVPLRAALPSALTLVDLVRKAQAGDRQALKELLQRVIEWLPAFIYAKVKCNPADLDVLVADTLIEVWKKIDSLADAKSFKKWVATIARRIGYKYIKARQRDRKNNVPIAEDAKNSIPDPRSSNQIKMCNAAINAINNLSPEEQIVIQCRYLREPNLTRVETASVLGLKPSRVAKIESAALARLWRELAQ